MLALIKDNPVLNRIDIIGRFAEVSGLICQMGKRNHRMSMVKSCVFVKEVKK